MHSGLLHIIFNMLGHLRFRAGMEETLWAPGNF